MTSAWGGHGALVRLRLAAGRVLHGAVGGIGVGVGEGRIDLGSGVICLCSELGDFWRLRLRGLLSWPATWFVYGNT